MTSLKTNIKGIVRRPASSSLIILAGVFVLIFTLNSGLNNYKKYNSPFDRVDQSPENQSGLLPILEAETASDASLLTAPSINRSYAADLLRYSNLSELSEDQILFGKIALDTLKTPYQKNIGLNPVRLIIPILDLFVDIRPVGFWEINFEGSIYRQWDTVDDYAVGWHNTSAGINTWGNTVISGHHNVHGKVFENLYTLNEGDVIQIKTVGNRLLTYRVALVLNLEEKYQPLEVRMENARWIQTSDDERITLVTCWPNDDNSNRIIVVALPVNG